MTRLANKADNSGDTAIGCAWILLAINTVLIGLTAFSFAQGPYSSTEQELWYRYGSIGFFLAGSVLPGITLYARRSLGVITAAISWMLLVLFAFVGFAMLSGGGV